MNIKRFSMILLLLVFAMSSARAQNGTDLLQRALRKEQVEGDLKGAIELYRQIASGASRALAAQALVQMGKAYEKLGASDARAAYQKVVNDFADQSKELAEARKRLKAIENSTSVDGKAGQIVIQKISPNRPEGWDHWVSFGDTRPSPDGRYFGYVNWTHGNLAVCEIQSGEVRDLTSEGTWVGRSQFTWGAVWSPDSKQIAYLWMNGEEGDLRIINRDGGQPRVLVTLENGGSIAPLDWSRDGRFIVGLGPIKKWADQAQKALRIVRVDVATGAVAVVKELPVPSDNVGVSLSPDARYIVYDTKGRWQDAPPVSQVRILKLDGSDDRALFEHPAPHSTPHWTPDGKGLVFRSKRSGEDALWAVAMKDGKAAGEPRVIRESFGGSRLLGFTDDGHLHFTASTPRMNVFVAEVDFEAAEIQPARLISLRHDGRNRNVRWSADGSRLAYLSARSAEWPPSGALVFHDFSDGQERDVQVAALNFSSAPFWSPDLTKLVGPAKVPGRGNNARALYSVDGRTGERSMFIDRDSSCANYTRDGRHLIYIHHDWKGADSTTVITERNLESNQERVILRTQTNLGFNDVVLLSPDGTTLAHCHQPYSPTEKHKTILFVTARADGNMRAVWELAEGEATVLDWLPDNRRVLVSVMNDRGAQQLHLVDVKRGQARPFGPALVGKDKIGQISVHPEGKHIAFSRGGVLSEIWTVRNFLPHEEKAAANNQPTIRQVASDKLGPWVAFGGGTPSPNGQYMTYVNWTHGNLALADLTEKTLKDLTTEGTWSPPDQFSFGGIWSPDSKQIAYLWMKGGAGDLRVIQRDGGKARIVVPEEKDGRIVPQVWTRDGRYIYGNTFSTPAEGLRTNRIVKVDVTTGRAETVAEFPGLTAWVTLSLSPDGKYIAYDFPGAYQLKYMGKEPVQGEIRIVDVDGSNDRVLIEHPADESRPAWAGDGKHLLFHSDRSGRTAFWALPVREGREAGEARFVREGALLGTTDDQTLYYNVHAMNYNIFIAEADFAAGKIGAPKLVSWRYDGKNRNPRWSRDGKKLGYVSRRDNAVLVFHDPTSGKDEEVELGSVEFSSRPQWSPDLTRLTGPARVPGGNVWGLFSIDVATRQRSLVVTESAPWGLFSSDANHLIHAKHSTDGVRVVDLDLRSKTERLISTNGMRQPTLSPDARWLAHWQRPYPVTSADTVDLMITSVETGSSKVARRFPADHDLHPLDWLPDNRRLLISVTNPKGTQQLRLVDTETMTDLPFGPAFEKDQHIQLLSIHPDGKTIAFQRGKQTEEIWTMRNFLGEEKIASK